ncbi:MAG TPA: hypothetical protein DDZ51_08055, partial [Planctomycetaceae bacterium]|nr:hypothetical protein [Planctomycetaceae bacterium]
MAWGLPAGAVLATTACWYLLDAIYNDYQRYVDRIGTKSLDNAWWQVCLFLFTFGTIVASVSKSISGEYATRRSSVLAVDFAKRLDHPVLQGRLRSLTLTLVGAWLGLMSIGLVRVNFDIQGLFAPYLGHKANPWSRGRVGGGIDGLLALAGYFQIFLTAGFGVLFALLNRSTSRWVAGFIFF